MVWQSLDQFADPSGSVNTVTTETFRLALTGLIAFCLGVLFAGVWFHSGQSSVQPEQNHAVYGRFGSVR